MACNVLDTKEPTMKLSLEPAIDIPMEPTKDMYDQLIYNILTYNTSIYDYSSIVKNPEMRSSLKERHAMYVKSKCADIIISTFSSLYYMHFMRRPRSRDEVNSVFFSLDYHGLFQDPNYYDFQDYMNVFKLFVDVACEYNVERISLLGKDKPKVCQSYLNLLRNVKKSKTLNALNLMI